MTFIMYVIEILKTCSVVIFPIGQVGARKIFSKIYLRLSYEGLLFEETLSVVAALLFNRTEN